MAGTFNIGKLADGAPLDVTDGYSYTTSFVDISSFSNYSVTVVFTGGSPVGTLTLQQSNDLQWTGQQGGPKPLHVGLTSAPDDTVNVPAGTGQVSASVSGAGAYAMNQFLVGYRWFRVVYTAITPANTTLDIFFCAKSG